MNPGDVSFLGFERKDNVFTVTFAWIDMIGGHHEHTFARGDIFADFNKVLKVFTDGGLPIDPAKADDFHMRLCQLSTVMVQEQAPAAKAGKWVAARNARQGDIVVFRIGRRLHTGLVADKGRFLHAPSSGGYVRMESLSGVYWKNKIVGYRRIV